MNVKESLCKYILRQTCVVSVYFRWRQYYVTTLLVRHRLLVSKQDGDFEILERIWCKFPRITQNKLSNIKENRLATCFIILQLLKCVYKKFGVVICSSLKDTVASPRHNNHLVMKLTKTMRLNFSQRWFHSMKLFRFIEYWRRRDRTDEVCKQMDDVFICFVTFWVARLGAGFF